MQRTVDLIFGQTGGGKSHYAQALFRNLSRAFVVEAGFHEFPATDFDSFPALVTHLEKIKAESPSQIFRVSYSPLMFEQELIFDVALWLKNLSLVIDEADRFEDPRMVPSYDEVITRGRHYGISIVAIGLHPFKLPKELRRQATRIVAFRQIDPNDIKWLEEVVGPRAQEIPSLEKFHYLEWTPDGGARICPPIPF